LPFAAEPTTPDEYVVFLREPYRRTPGRSSAMRERSDRAAVLYQALVAVAEMKGWAIAGGERAPGQQNLSGRYVL
jgi:hypothetical protein